MHVLLCFVLLFSSSLSFAQDRYYTSPYYSSTSSYDYSYNIEDYTPSFLGLVLGYNFLKEKEVEAGLAYNFVETTTSFGMTAGYQLIYRRSLERDLNAVDLCRTRCEL